MSVSKTIAHPELKQFIPERTVVSSRRSVLLGLSSLLLTGCVSEVDHALSSSAPKIIAHGGGRMEPSFASDIAGSIGGKGAGILISPYSGDPKSTAQSDLQLLRHLGFRNLSVLDLSRPGIALEMVSGARAIWFSGGAQKNQVLALSAVSGMRDALHAAYRRGCLMVGGSAGAAVMTKLMISGGTDGAVYTRQGLGFWSEAVIDQHVAQRNREYRLRRVIADNPNLIGVGLDESTWIAHQGETFLVRGRGAVHVVTVGLSGGVEEIRLRSGARYDLRSRSKM